MSNPTHWLVFNEARGVVGCHCGFKAADEDEGYGDSVVDHLLVVELEAYHAVLLAHEDAPEWTTGQVLDDLGDWIKSVHEWPVRRFNPLNVPHWITHSLSSSPTVVSGSQTNGGGHDSD